MADKYFNRHEAEELLPLIQDCLVEARVKKEKIDSLNADLARAAAQIMVLGGSIPNYGELVATKAERDRFEAQLEEAINRIQATGCVVKDLDAGLVDFPTLIGGEEVYLCWKLGEERIGYYHGLDEGFAWRKPLDDTPPDEEPPPSPPRVQ